MGDISLHVCERVSGFSRILSELGFSPPYSSPPVQFAPTKTEHDGNAVLHGELDR